MRSWEKSRDLEGKKGMSENVDENSDSKDNRPKLLLQTHGCKYKRVAFSESAPETG